ncbi:MAG: L-seryl-tRNA(Sec) selenium transferase [Oscillospiraceae bacterium]|nr:L-seryl-tRNA(Sec) selenium transferase [Oscillospiraceae bacterium]
MNTLLEREEFRGMDRERVKRLARAYLDGLRENVTAGKISEVPDAAACARGVLELMEREDREGIRGVINATGIVLHTNLGRAPLGETLYKAVERVYSGYSSLEYDVESGERGSRCAQVEKLICEMSGAEAAMAVNNNAAAVFLALSELAKGKKVAISRGELVEIGGSFRIPEIMAQSGAELMEVGCTNKTRLSDYEAALDGGAELLLKVHTSNYRIVGFSASVTAKELAELAHGRGVPLIYDMGSCFAVDPGLFGINGGHTAREGIDSGADVICFSGDKLTGSAQAGIIAGRREYISRMKKNPLARVVRADKLTVSALEQTLKLCRYPDTARKNVPVLSMLARTSEELKRQAEELAEKISAAAPGWSVDICPTSDEAGGGSLPATEFPGWAVCIEPKGMTLTEFERLMRLSPTPIVLRLHDSRALISPRTLMRGDGEEIAARIGELYGISC